MQYDAAISYASEDTEVADTIATRLRRDGFRCFYSPNRLHKLIGRPLPKSLAALYGDPDVVVIALLSGPYRVKDWPQMEYRAATARQPNKMFVVRMDDDGIPTELANHSYADLARFGAEGVASQISAALESEFQVRVTMDDLAGQQVAGQVEDIAALDNPDRPYSLDRVRFVDAQPENVVDLEAPAPAGDLDELVTFGRDGPPIGVTVEEVAASKKEVLDLIRQKRDSGWEVFNGRKFGVSSIHRSRTPHEEDHLLRVELYETDYFSSLFAKRLYRRVRDRLAPNPSKSLKNYVGLMRSFGFDLI